MHLTADDAVFVDVIHADAGSSDDITSSFPKHFGHFGDVGDLDVFVSDGKYQPLWYAHHKIITRNSFLALTTTQHQNTSKKVPTVIMESLGFTFWTQSVDQVRSRV